MHVNMSKTVHRYSRRYCCEWRTDPADVMTLPDRQHRPVYSSFAAGSQGTGLTDCHGASRRLCFLAQDTCGMSLHEISPASTAVYMGPQACSGRSQSLKTNPHQRRSMGTGINEWGGGGRYMLPHWHVFARMCAFLKIQILLSCMQNP